MTKVSSGIPLLWKKLAKELAPFYPSKNRGFPFSRRQVYAEIARRQGVSVRTVERYMGRAMLKREYARERGRVIGHLEVYLPQLFNGDTELLITDISNKLHENTRIEVSRNVLERILEKYESTPKGSPLVKTESGNYQLNKNFYQTK